MKILQIITLSELGGAQWMCANLIRGLRSKGWDVDVACYPDGWLDQQMTQAGVSVFALPHMCRPLHPFKDLQTIGDIHRLLKKGEYQLVHCHSSKAGLLGRLTAWINGTPSVFTAHGWGFKPGVPFVRRWLVWLSETLMALLSARIICVSHYDTLLARKYHVASQKTLITIHNGLEEQAQLAMPERQPAKLIMVARFQEPKDHSLLLRAFAALDAPHVELFLVGGGPQMTAAQELARELQILDRAHFLGDRIDVPDLLADSQLFVLLSRYEGLPISILEAMRAGLPVVASDVGGISEEVQDGITGFLVPAQDVQAATGALQTLLDDPQLRSEMGTAGRAKFLNEFTVERMLVQTEQVYKQILAGKVVRISKDSPVTG